MDTLTSVKENSLNESRYTIHIVSFDFFFFLLNYSEFGFVSSNEESGSDGYCHISNPTIAYFNFACYEG